MAKVYGLNGYLRGKLGNTVFAIRNGEQLSRQFNPNPMNPKTALQVANRAKLKMLSQLSAALQPVIAIPRVGMVSPRNGFTQANYQYTAFAGDNASIDLADIQLTKSSVALSGFSADRTGGSGIAVEMQERIDAANDAVVYVVLRRTDANKVAVASSMLVREAGANGTFPATLEYQDGDIAVCAYGIRYNTVAARTAFGNLNAPSALGVARLFANRTLTEGDATMTETRGLFMASGEVSGETAGVVRYTIGVTTFGDGTATGGGRYELGTQVTLVATPQEGATFLGWYLDSVNGTLLSSSPSYSLTVEGAMNIVAKFSALPKTITVSAFPEGTGVVTGGGTKEVGSSCTVEATPNSGYRFVGWYEGVTRVSNSASYTFTVEGDRNLMARFDEIHGITLTTDGASCYLNVYPNSSASTPSAVYQKGDVMDLTAGESYYFGCGSMAAEFDRAEYWDDNAKISDVPNADDGSIAKTIPAGCKTIKVFVG